MIEAPLLLQKQQTIPQDFYNLCKDQGEPYTGNAAGNTQNLLDLSGANLSVAPLPTGFTAKGIVALVFSCVAAVFGMASITRLVFPLSLSYSRICGPCRPSLRICVPNIALAATDFYTS